MISGIEAKIRESPQNRTPRKAYALEIAKLGKRLYDGQNTVAWCGISAPFDLLSAMGVTSCFVEFIGAMLASTGLEGEFLEAAEHAGYAGDACGYHRAVMGAAIKGWMPEPDLLIATTCPCSGGLAVIENLAAHYKKDLFVLNVPKEDDEQSVRYLAGQLERMVKFVEERTGRRLDPDRLRQAVENTNRTRTAIDAMYRHAMHVPSPVSGKMLGNYGIGVPVLNLEVDCIDSRNFMEGQIRTRLEAFMEMLDGRPSPWG